MILIGFIIFGKKRLGFGFWIARGSSGAWMRPFSIQTCGYLRPFRQNMHRLPIRYNLDPAVMRRA
jgi:hypothetical protein